MNAFPMSDANGTVTPRSVTASGAGFGMLGAGVLSVPRSKPATPVYLLGFAMGAIILEESAVVCGPWARRLMLQRLTDELCEDGSRARLARGSAI